MSKFTSETAKEAGEKSKRGKSQKTKQWELLGQKITNEYTERVFNYMDTLEGKDFFNAYLNVLEYFKPKLNRTDLSNDDGSINVHLTPLTFFKTDEGDKDK